MLLVSLVIGGCATDTGTTYPYADDSYRVARPVPERAPESGPTRDEVPHSPRMEVLLPEQPLLPESAGDRPEPHQAHALIRYLRELPEWNGGDSLRWADTFPTDAKTVARSYLDLIDIEGATLQVVDVESRRKGAYYGRVDITVSAIDPFSEDIPAIEVRGPTVFSGVSATDAVLTSLFTFPMEALQRAVDRTRQETERFVAATGFPYSVAGLAALSGTESEYVSSVLLSAGNRGDEAMRWWFFLPPEELAGHIDTFRGFGSTRIAVDNAKRTVIVNGGEER